MRAEDHITQIRNLLKDAVPIPGCSQRLAPAVPIIPPAASRRQVFDSITRESILGRIRDLQRMFSLHWLVRQETFNRGTIDVLEDRELTALLKTMEQARECIADGVDLHEAGLVRPTLSANDDALDGC